jgi:hypothetical protein
LKTESHSGEIMETPMHSLVSLFAQLGLDNTDEAIDSFVSKNGPLPGNVQLDEADFWSPSQASFLKEAIDEDADWAEIVDQLDAMLR